MGQFTHKSGVIKASQLPEEPFQMTGYYWNSRMYLPHEVSMLLEDSSGNFKIFWS